MAETFDELLELLDLEELEVNLFRGFNPREDRERVFGGQVAAQAMVAARRTVESERRAHSLHGYFLRSGDPGAPILYQVDRIRDGRSFATRRVVAVQHGRAIFNMSVSFQVEEQGYEHAFEMPEAPDPETLPCAAEHLRAAAGEGVGEKLMKRLTRDRPVDIRWCDPPGWKPRAGQEPRTMVWMRVKGRLP
ncbi:MAG: acyl-CoA thioesterase, partial [Candidatus Binatia bacterium]